MLGDGLGAALEHRRQRPALRERDPHLGGELGDPHPLVIGALGLLPLREIDGDGDALRLTEDGGAGQDRYASPVLAQEIHLPRRGDAAARELRLRDLPGGLGLAGGEILPARAAGDELGPRIPEEVRAGLVDVGDAAALVGDGDEDEDEDEPGVP